MKNLIVSFQKKKNDSDPSFFFFAKTLLPFEPHLTKNEIQISVQRGYVNVQNENEHTTDMQMVV